MLSLHNTVVSEFISSPRFPPPLFFLLFPLDYSLSIPVPCSLTIVHHNTHYSFCFAPFLTSPRTECLSVNIYLFSSRASGFEGSSTTRTTWKRSGSITYFGNQKCDRKNLTLWVPDSSLSSALSERDGSQTKTSHPCQDRGWNFGQYAEDLCDQARAGWPLPCPART
jgi:hypothetical protein